MAAHTKSQRKQSQSSLSPKGAPAEPPEEKQDSAPTSTPVVFSLGKRSLWVLCLVAIAPWLLAGGWLVVSRWADRPQKAEDKVLPGISGAGNSARVIRGNHGPWGDIEYVRIALEPPDEFISTELRDRKAAWFFDGRSREQVLALMASAPLTAEQRKVLQDPASIQDVQGGLLIEPSDEIVLSLSPKARSMIYDELARFPRNVAQQNAFVFRPELLDERLEGSGLTAESISLFKNLLYRQENRLMFADMRAALPKLPDEHERLRFIKTVARRNTLIGSLRITPDTDVEQLVNYWGGDGRAKDIRPLLESLRRVPDGALLDVAHLLPPFARRRLYTYPTPELATGGGGPHWTAMNFYSEQPDDRFNDDRLVTQTIQKNYYLIASGVRLGDLVALMTASGAAVHTAVYVADGIAFTRNGVLPTNPWQLMRVEDMVEFFASRTPSDEPLTVRYFRLRDRSVLAAP